MHTSGILLLFPSDVNEFLPEVLAIYSSSHHIADAAPSYPSLLVQRWLLAQLFSRKYNYSGGHSHSGVPCLTVLVSSLLPLDSRQF